MDGLDLGGVLSFSSGLLEMAAALTPAQHIESGMREESGKREKLNGGEGVNKYLNPRYLAG